MTQQEQVLNHLRAIHSMHDSRITSQQAWRYYSITRLADVIFKLRRRGYDIETEMVRNGSVSFARYRLKT